MLVPFVDAGRVFDRVENTTLRDLRFAVGGGLRVAWNLSTIIGLDYAWSPERDAIYFRLDHPF
jgi:outer membrane translocation and assembly module TamA